MLGVIFAATLQVVTAAPVAPDVDAVFAQWTAATPGCAVGVSVDDQVVLARSYGSADLEHGVRIGPDTIFEAGSVSKQFTAAAVLLLAQERELSIDEDVRTYLPELPDLRQRMTLRHMLTHTSGLRDWGSVEGLAGWPRTTRVYTHAHVLDVLSRQRALNFPPGTRWSYSNSGYNLAAIVVARVSGMSFAEFTRKRIFEPLGMTHTSWRDDHTRVVAGRAVAYEKGADGYHTDMPFEDVHGNGGLLTTVGDLLKWNAHFANPAIGGRAFVAEQERIGRFADGRAHNYAMGLQLGTYRGLAEVGHSGSTAGYRAHLVRFPEARASVAVLCNTANANATTSAYAVADKVLARRLAAREAPAARHTLTTAEAGAVVGIYRPLKYGAPIVIEADGTGLRAVPAVALVIQSATRFATASGQTWDVDGKGTLIVTDAFGTVDTFERTRPVPPSDALLVTLAGTYSSPDIETAVTVSVVGHTLAIHRRPDTVMPLTPLYEDVFKGDLGIVTFRRDTTGRVVSFSVTQERVWDLRFDRQPGTPNR